MRTPFTARSELEEDGSNLTNIILKILSDKEKKRKFVNLLNYILPYIDGVNVQKTADKLNLLLRERYTAKSELPAFLISDGTMNVLNLIVALFFENKAVCLIEEPEKSIHPHLIANLVEMMKDASSQKQIIVTTHNPEIVKHAGLEHLLLVSRDQDGFSVITRPANKKEVQIFLQNEIGLDELYVQNLLEF
ncbi:MAG: AAA family ATPase [bacterium]